MRHISQKIEAGILQFVDDVITKKIELRAHPTKRLHAKIYIFRPKGFNEHKPGAVITGSSNLTGAGLGKDEDSSNYEFNVLLHDYDDVCFRGGGIRTSLDGIGGNPPQVFDRSSGLHLPCRHRLPIRTLL